MLMEDSEWFVRDCIKEEIHACAESIASGIHEQGIKLSENWIEENGHDLLEYVAEFVHDITEYTNEEIHYCMDLVFCEYWLQYYTNRGLIEKLDNGFVLTPLGKVSDWDIMI